MELEFLFEMTKMFWIRIVVRVSQHMNVINASKIYNNNLFKW